MVVEDTDSGLYLSRKLRQLDPEPFDVEIQRVKKQALRRGLLVGVLASALVALMVGAVWFFSPDLLQSIAGLAT